MTLVTPRTALNAKKGIWIERIPLKTEEWYARRLQGIGASEIGTVLGQNPYAGGSVIELFYQKLGLMPQFKEGNKYTFWGNTLEDAVADVWQYYDGTDDGYIANSEAKIKKRACRKVNGFVTNDEFPYLFTNLDRVMQKGSFRITDGTILEHDIYPVQCKTLSSFIAKKWELGIPPQYVSQVAQEGMILGVDYGEIAALSLDDRKFFCYPVVITDRMREGIEENSYTFWHKMVQPAMEYKRLHDVALSRGDQDECNRLMSEIARFEPPADASESYKDFMNARYLSEVEEVDASPEIVTAAKRLKMIKILLKEIEPYENLYGNQIRDFMQKAEALNLGSAGKMTWRTNAKGARPLNTAGIICELETEVNNIKAIIDEQIHSLSLN